MSNTLKKLFHSNVVNLNALCIAQQYVKELPEPFTSIFSSNNTNFSNVVVHLPVSTSTTITNGKHAKFKVPS
jgi:hypothetical protein